MENTDWFEDRGELLAVAQILVETDTFSTPGDVIDFLTKPWKWADDRDLWVGAGRPSPGGTGWKLFTRRLDHLYDPGELD